MNSEKLWDLAANISTLASLVETNNISPNRLIFKLRQLQEDCLRMYYVENNKETRTKREHNSNNEITEGM